MLPSNTIDMLENTQFFLCNLCRDLLYMMNIDKMLLRMDTVDIPWYNVIIEWLLIWCPIVDSPSLVTMKWGNVINVIDDIIYGVIN